MQNYKEDTTFELKLLHFIGIVAVCMGFILLYFGTGAGVLKILGISNAPVIDGLSLDQKGVLKNGYLIAQFVASITCLVILPSLYLYFLKPGFQVLKLNTKQLIAFLMFSLLIMFSIIPLINFIIDWNQSLHLPAFFSALENKFKEMEEMAEKTTELIIYYQNFTDFIVILIVAGILPAIGEELLFRGIVQNELKDLCGNPHVAIWFAAFLFSFVHFQFFGFFPRMLLGIILGYLYYWSGNILVPMFLHFMNNAITLIIMNLVHRKAINLDLNSSKQIPASYIIFSFTISMVLLYIFWKTSQRNKTSNA